VLLVAWLGIAWSKFGRWSRRLVVDFVSDSNTVRLHSAIASFTPADKLAGRAQEIWAASRQKLAAADARRRAKTRVEEMDQPQWCEVH
jgi:hypothetical protein